MPEKVIGRAREILDELHSNEITHKHTTPQKQGVESKTENNDELQKLASFIKKINVDSITPLEALTTINTMKEIISTKGDK